MDYTLQLIDNTGLDSTQFSIFVMGFSYASKLVLNTVSSSNVGTCGTQSSGTVPSFQVGTGTGQLTQITLDASTPFTGGRFYIFIAPAGTAAPSVDYGAQPTNPPNTKYPPYSIVEITVPSPGASAPNPATIDVQTVDGFIFPLTITLNGQTNVAGQQYGQPLYTAGETPVVNRAAIFTAFNNFLDPNVVPAWAPYLDLVFTAGGLDGQPGGILNPGAYLTATDAQNQFQNLSSALQTVFDSDLSTLFGTTTLSIQGVASTDNSIKPAVYTVTSVDNQTYPGTTVSLPALQLSGGGNVFNLFSPIGLSILTDTQGNGIAGTISGDTLTLNTPVSGLQVGMFVSGAGLSPVNGLSTTQITAVGTDSSGNPQLTLNQSLGNPAPNSQYTFSFLPQLVTFQTPGQMVFANSGVFADSTIQFADGSPQSQVLGNLENQLVSALNRGVATNAAALNPATAGGTSAFWGTETNWYPAGATQNLFSLFMHVAQVTGTPIFFQPAGAVANAQGQTMGSAYGFAYDENGGPVPPAPIGPEVPSKFDQNVPPGATIQITLGPWTSTQTEHRPIVRRLL